jgi:GMP synthase-like glutamine amidotransferase
MILIVDCGYTSIYKLEDLVDQFSDYKTVSIYDIDFEEIQKLNPKGAIISHAHISINETNVDKYIEKIQAVLKLEIPVLGIGVGHHLLGVYFGALPAYEPYRNELVEIGILETDGLFDKLPNEVELIKDNAGTISIPPGFQLLASSDYSINEAMKKNDKPLYGVQFIPEVSGNLGAVIMDNFVNISLKKAD